MSSDLTDSTPYYTPDQYLEMERESQSRSEYLDGNLYPISGASESHILITGNLSGELRTQLRGGHCRSYSSDMKVLVSSTGLYAYPDVVVVCEERRFRDNRRDILLNPNVIFEVFSPGSELYDRTRKFEHYRCLESLSDYLLVAQDRPYVEHYIKQDDQEWLLRFSEGLNGTIYIPSIECTLALSDVYENVEFLDEGVSNEERD